MEILIFPLEEQLPQLDLLYLKSHYPVLLGGFAFMILQNYGYSRVPLYIQKILDEIIGANRFSEIRSYTLYALFFGALTAFCMYLMRKMIISVSRKIEYSLHDAPMILMMYVPCWARELCMFPTQ